MKVVRTLLAIAAITIAFALAATLSAQSVPAAASTAPAQPKPVSQVDSVIDLVKSGLSEGLIIKYLRQAGKPDDLSPGDLLRLQQAHVPDNVIVAMIDPGSAPAPVPIAAEPAVAPQLPVAPSLPATREVKLPIGTEIAIRTIDAIESKGADLGKEYAASLDGPLTVDGIKVVPAKVTAFLRITEARQAGKLRGSASLSLQLIAVTVNGRRVPLETGDVVSQSAAKGKNTAVRGGVGGAGGAAIGGIVGGGLGAGIGAAAGATAGLGSAVFNKPTVKVPPETRLTFKLTQAAVIN
jgi:hypothetical protein